MTKAVGRLEKPVLPLDIFAKIRRSDQFGGSTVLGATSLDFSVDRKLTDVEREIYFLLSHSLLMGLIFVGHWCSAEAEHEQKNFHISFSFLNYYR
jgi:hypothetical protein